MSSERNSNDFIANNTYIPDWIRLKLLDAHLSTRDKLTLIFLFHPYILENYYENPTAVIAYLGTYATRYRTVKRFKDEHDVDLYPYMEVFLRTDYAI